MTGNSAPATSITLLERLRQEPARQGAPGKVLLRANGPAPLPEGSAANGCGLPPLARWGAGMG